MNEKGINDIYDMLKLLNTLFGEYLILNYPNEKYYVLKLLSEYMDLEDD